MNGYLRQSTASQSRLIGPFVDDTDFKTAETALTIANTDIKLRANGTTLSNKNSGGGTHQVNGMYSVTFDATDTANVGELAFSVAVAGALAVFGSYVVLEEAVYDALFAASALGYIADQPVNATKIGGTTQTGRDIGANVLLSPGTGTGQVDLSSGKVLLQATQTGVTIPTVTSVTNGVTVSTNNDKTGYGLSSAAVQGIWDALTSALTTAGSIGKWILDKLDVVVSTRLASASYAAPLDAAGVRSAVGLASANLDTQLSTIDDLLDTEVAAIKSKTDNLPASPAATGDIPTTAEITNAVLDEAALSHNTTGTVGAAIISILNQVLNQSITSFRASSGASTQFWIRGGRIPAAMQGESVVTVELLSIEYDDQYKNLLFAISDPSTGMGFSASIRSSDQAANTVTLSNPVPVISGLEDPIGFVILPSGLGDASRALILYEGS